MFRRIIPRSCRCARLVCQGPQQGRGHGFRKGRLIPVRQQGQGYGWPFSDLSANIRQMEKEMSRLFDDLQHSNRFRPSFFRPWGGRREQTASINQDVEVKYNEKEFSIKLDVQDYSEGELKVKVVEDRVVVSGKVQEKQDEHGFVSQEFSRQFLIPENVDPETIESSICAEGVLTIQGQVTGAENIEEREIPINKEPPKETKND